MDHSEQEERLLLKAQRGDREALGALWDTLTPKLFGYLVNTVRDRTLAEDLLQSTWLRAIEALPRFERRGVSIAAWLFAIARNECRQHWRKSGREVPLDLTQHDRADEQSSNVPEKILMNQVLGSLAEDDRELLRLRYIADLSIRDIARILNRNSVAVRVRLHRTLARARTTVISHHL